MTALAKLAPWRARPLAETAKIAHARRVMDLRAESVLLGRSAIIAGWSVGGVGVCAFVASAVGWLYIILVQLPAMANDVKFYGVDHSTGIIAAPVSVRDAPATFPEATDQHYLKVYIQACEQWVPEMDRQNERMCKLMSTPDEQARHVARRNSTGPAKTVGRGGYVELDNFRYHHQATDDRTHTRRYWVQFDRTVWRGGEKTGPKTWSTTVDFQYHPELTMFPADRVDNPGGFQALSNSVTDDTPTPGTEMKR